MEGEIGIVRHHPIARLTAFFFEYRLGVLLFPLPWVGVAIISCARGRIHTHSLVLFSSTLILSICILSIVMALALSLPWLPERIVTMGIGEKEDGRQSAD